MPSVAAKTVFETNYCDLEQVKALAKKFGKGQIVIKYPWRKNFNIIHAENEERSVFEGASVVWRT